MVMLHTLLSKKTRQFVVTMLTLLTACQINSAPPLVAGISPSYGEIPANTLRLYITFSQPMKRGQVRQKIKLFHNITGEIQNPFLNLGTELWDQQQIRLTLLFDPGRIKQKVGPNIQVGAPLIAGESYLLKIAGTMTSAKGHNIGNDTLISYKVVAAEKRRLSIDDWEVLYPTADSEKPFILTFDRLVDSVAASRLIRVLDANNTIVPGVTHVDGKVWQFVPEKPWTIGRYQIVFHPELEDVSGNNLHSAFDAPTGTLNLTPKEFSLPFEVKFEG